MGRITEFREVRHVADITYPEEGDLDEGVLYIVDDSPYVQYLCPCGCGSDVLLPTNKHERGYDGWGFVETGGAVSLSPSVYSSGLPCKSHYFIRNNRIDWC